MRGHYSIAVAVLSRAGAHLRVSSLSFPRTRQQKRKVDEEHSEEEGEGHEDFDPQQLREHEEFTKVTILLGMEWVCEGVRGIDSALVS